jgi:diguanylate cyclase (GGDEF)-like protein
VGVDFWSPRTLKSLLLPGGVLLLAASVVFRGAFGPIPHAAISFYYYAVFAAGVLLAWRFHSSRIMFALLTLLLGHRALEFFSSGRMTSAGPGRIALEAVAFLLPLNFIYFSVSRERGAALPAIVPRLALLFFESVFVAIICRPGEITAPAFLRPGFLGSLPWMRIPTLAVLAFAAALAALLVRFLSHGKPTESGLLWALVVTFFSLQAGGVGPAATAYWATAGLILVSSIIETSYLLAYHDELTTLPARRAFNDALFHLEEPYAVAVVDIDHFKKFNDTYGHETGDQVLRLVAGKLAGVTGGGRAYRVGGEEFSILFPGKSAKEVLPHLELLRSVVEVSSFQLRGGQERRGAAPSSRSRDPNGRAQENSNPESRSEEFQGRERRAADRRADTRRTSGSRSRTRSPRLGPTPPASRPLSVTVSIGLAEPDARARAPEQVVQAADKALYRAKQSGRNRVESGAAPRPAKPRRNIA